MKKPYINKITEIAGLTVYNVDGNYIRNKINREFTNFGQHYRFPCVPRNELWIDKESDQGETRFYIDHMLVERRLMANGMKYEKAIVIADKIEKKEREKTKLYKKLIREKKIKKIPDEVYVKKIKRYSNGLNVFIVNGEVVRDLYFIDFTEGGHEFVYDFVPEGEVWLDDDLKPIERKFVLVHELHERNLMKKGMEYHHAHHSASIIEYKCRHKPRITEKYIQEEYKKAISN